MLGTVASVLLGAVFVIAAATKLVDRQAWQMQAAALGAPPPAAVVVPWWELVVGSLLLVGALRPWPAVAALVTLVAFTVLLVAVLRRGEHPPCACFGAVSARPLGWGHVMRNVVLIGLAVVAIIVAG